MQVVIPPHMTILGANRCISVVVAGPPFMDEFILYGHGARSPTRVPSRVSETDGRVDVGNSQHPHELSKPIGAQAPMPRILPMSKAQRNGPSTRAGIIVELS